jgi:HSP90 family molecular chaperone
LHAFDSELRKVDSLLADNRRERVEVKGVAQVEEPSRLAKLIKTEGWKPVDTQIRISKVADIVSKLGGKDLYGRGTEVPLRELLQNAADAVRARRVMDGKDSEWGEIYVRSGEDKTGSWIEVEDSGVGMSETVLTGPFLDFGASFWGSALMQEELPGLGAKGFHSIGRYGIGFFSIFMVSERVDVFTRRYDKAREDTLVLSFKNGLKERPLLRKSNADERMPDGGTRIKAWLSEVTRNGRYTTTIRRNELSLTQLCSYVAPCLDVTIKAREDDAPIATAVVANDLDDDG